MWATPETSWFERGQTSPETWTKRMQKRQDEGKAPFATPLHVQVAQWATPTAANAGGGQIAKGISPTGRRPDGTKATVSLNQQVKDLALWPTPGTDNANGGRNFREDGTKYRQGSSYGMTLVDATEVASAWPTPTTRDHKSGTGAQEREGHAPPLTDVVKGRLNPVWVCQLMGFPDGWLDVSLPDQGKPKKIGKLRASSRKQSRSGQQS